MTPVSRATNHTLGLRTTLFGRRLDGTRVLRAEKIRVLFFHENHGCFPERVTPSTALFTPLADVMFLRLR